MFNVLVVGLGGFIGSALRYLVGGWAQGLSRSPDFPYGTFFSSFGNDTLNLARSGQMLNALVNVAANVIFGLLLVWLGRTVAYAVWR